MKAGVVADDHMHDFRVAGGEIFEIERIAAEAHSWQMRKVRLPCGHLQRAVKVVLLILGLSLHHRA